MERSVQYTKILKRLEKFTNVIVSGPQRSGTTFISKCLADDLGYKMIPEEVVSYDNKDELIAILETSDNKVVQCPAQSIYLEEVVSESTIVVFSRRDLIDIQKSEERIAWNKQCYFNRNLSYSQRDYEKFKLIKKVSERPDVYPVVDFSKSISEIKYNFWETYQKRLIKNYIEVNYEDFKKFNPGAWVQKKDRVSFRSRQVSDKHPDILEELDLTLSKGANQDNRDNENSNQKPVVSLYYNNGSGFTEKNKIVRVIELIHGASKFLQFELSNLGNIVGLRIDPCDEKCAIKISLARLKIGNVWAALNVSSNAFHENNQLYYFDNEDPQFYFEVESQFNSALLELKLDYLAIGANSTHQLLLKEDINIETTSINKEILLKVSNNEKNYESISKLLSNQNKTILSFTKVEDEYKQIIEQNQNQINNLNAKLNEKDLNLNEKDVVLNDLKVSLEEKDLTNVSLQKELDSQLRVLNQLKQDKNELKDILEHRFKSIHKLEKEVSILTERLEIKSEELKQADGLVSLKENEVKVLFNELRANEILITKLKTAQTLNKQILKEKDELAQQYLSRLEEKSIEIVDKSKENDKLKNQSEKIFDQYEGLLKKSEVLIEDANFRMNQLEEQTNRIKYLHKNNEAQSKKLAEYQGYLEDNRRYIHELKSSLSFRLGWIFTFPFRTVYNLFSINTHVENRRWFWLRLLALGIQKPFKLLKHLNRRNIKTLGLALKHEHPRTIIENFKNLLKDQPVGKNEELSNDSNTTKYTSDESNLELLRVSNFYDENYYVEFNPDVLSADISPVEHYLHQGWKEGRDPSRVFCTDAYLSSNPDVMNAKINPLIHYITQGILEGREISLVKEADQIAGNSTHKGILNPYEKITLQPEYEDEELFALPELDVKPIAFFLPQFHPFEENDKFWGKGFTEWTNTTKALPVFQGHYQPRLPGELGFYDLRLKEVLKRQVELAKRHGIYGFCFHHYFFDGKPIMRIPVDHMLENKDIDFPFCLHWANEPWTSKFDGGIEKGEVLLEQNHNPQDDIAFFKYIEPALHDSRYIKIKGRPLLLIYRPSLFPNFKKTVKRWQECAVKSGLNSLYLVIVETGFERVKSPTEWNCDAAVEFPPHHARTKPHKEELNYSTNQFEGLVYDYDQVVSGSKERSEPPYKLFRGIFPDWDNTARRKESTIFYGSTPHRYQKWLENLCQYTQKSFTKDERFVFINAWNEWAEGAYLEPDRKYGYAYLNATTRALKSLSSRKVGSTRILFISHDANFSGAQLILNNLLKWIKEHSQITIKIICGSGGEMVNRFQEYGDTIIFDTLKDSQISTKHLTERLFDFCEGKPDLIYLNSVGSGKMIDSLKEMDVPIITHVHELQNSIEVYASDYIEDIIQHTDHFIACSNAVANNLVDNYNVTSDKINTIYEFIDITHEKTQLNHEKQKLREALDIEADKLIVFGSGFGLFWRKGADLFIEIAKSLLKLGVEDFHFYWLGELDEGYSHEKYGTWKQQLKKIEAYGLSNYVTFLGRKNNVFDYYSTGDVFILPSREDPYPLVCLEAASCQLPVLCFKDAGGMPDFVEADAGFVVPYEDVSGMAKKIQLLWKDKELRKKLGAQAQRKVHLNHSTDVTAPYILDVCRRIGKIPPLVSIILPNYNYERYLDKRLTTIFNQTFLDFELIILDDASSDNSMKLVEKYLNHPFVRVLSNKKNSGSVFSQWIKGLKLSSGDIIWIAEADDYSNPLFLEKMLPSFIDFEVNIAYCQSTIVGESDEELGKHDYFNKLSPGKWDKDYVNPIQNEVNEGLGIMNTIPNVSAVLFRRVEADEIKDIRKLKSAGDWLFYLMAARGGKIAYRKQSLNYHRRHSESVIMKHEGSKEFLGETWEVHQYILNNFITEFGLGVKMLGHAKSEWKRLIQTNIDGEFYKFYDNKLIKARSSSQQTDLRVLVVLSDLGTGGGQTVAIRLANSLTQKGVIVHLLNVGRHPTNTKIRDLISSKITVVNKDDWVDPKQGFSDYISKHQIGVVHSHIWWADKFVYQVISNLKVNWVVTMHGCYEFLLSSPESDLSFTKIFPDLISKVDHFVYLTDKNIKIFDDYQVERKKLTQIYNGYSPVFPRARRRKELGISDDAFIVGIVSRAIPEKGWIESIKAVQRINEGNKKRNVHLILVGESDFSHELSNKYSLDYVHFTGFSTNPLEWIQLFDVGLLPSYFISESLPTSVIEYMAAQKPTIASDIGEIKSMLTQNNKSAGIIIETSEKGVNINDLSTSILKYLNDSKVYKEHVNNCKYLFKQFSMKDCLDKYLKLYGNPRRKQL